MEHELTYSALQAIGMATGAALCASLGLMQFRVDRATGGPGGYQLLWVVGFIWTLGRFLRSMLQLAGFDADDISVGSAEALAWSCTILGPIAIGRFLQARLRAKSRQVGAFLMFTGVASIVNLGLFVAAASTHGLDLDASWYPEMSLYVALIVTAVALLLYRFGRHQIGADLAGSRPRWFGRGAFLLAVFQVSAALLTLRDSWLPAGVHAALSLIGEHWAIPWSIFIAVSLAQIHHADIVLKRSLWLLASVSIAALASMFVFQAPPGFALVVATLGCACLMLSAPMLIRALNFLVDRVYLDRPDYLAAASDFEDSVRRVYDREQLFDAALLAVRSTLRVGARWVSADDVAADSPAGVLASIRIETDNHPGYRLQVSASHHARTLMAEELRFLNAIGTHVSRRLDAIYFEQQQRALHLREERLKRLLTEAELKALRTQVDPHFLFNTLNTIADLIGSRPVQAERMTERLAECFRYALTRHARDLSTLDDELEFARHYLDIEQERFGDRLRVQVSRGDAHGDECVPSLLLQPLLENAIKHGLAPLREGGCISIAAKREGEYLRLQVDDDGVGLRPDFRDRPGVGLRNVTARLQTLYAQAARFAIDSRLDGRGTSVTVLVPLHGN